jgi:hypothetical protein
MENFKMKGSEFYGYGNQSPLKGFLKDLDRVSDEVAGKKTTKKTTTPPTENDSSNSKFNLPTGKKDGEVNTEGINTDTPTPPPTTYKEPSPNKNAAMTGIKVIAKGFKGRAESQQARDSAIHQGVNDAMSRPVPKI